MKVAIIQYSTYGHVASFAQSIKEGVDKSGRASQCDIFQVPETLDEEVLRLIHAPSKSSMIPVATTATLEEYDAFLFGVPTRFGTTPAQFNAFWDGTGALWASGALYHKPAGVFVSTGSPNGGQEMTVRSFLTYLAHHGMIYIPLGYGPAGAHLSSFDEPHGGSPWGAGSLAGTDGSKLLSDIERETAIIQGGEFAKSARRFVQGSAESKQPQKEIKVVNSRDAATIGEQKKAGQLKAEVSQPEKSYGCGVKCVIV